MTDRNPNPVDDPTRSPQEHDAEHGHPAQPLGDVFHAEYSDDESPSGAVISAVSAVEGVEPTELGCLYDRIDPDALDTLLNGPEVSGNSGFLGVEFQYSGYRVTVRNNGSITVIEDPE